MENKREEYGALWEKESARGTYMTGTVEVEGVKVNVVAFKNDNKKNPKEPDWRLIKSVPQETKNESAIPKYTTEDVAPADIPF